jgi:colanic acid/amylovoran biosynthesis protein
MVKILIIGASHLTSIGVHAMVISTMTALNSSIPDAEFTIYSPYPEVEHKLYGKYNFNLRVVTYGGSSKLKKMFCLLQEYIKTDIIVGIYGDALIDATVSTTVLYSFSILLSSLLRKPYVLYPQSMGHFKSKFSRFLVKFAFNRATSITAREEITKNNLQEIGVNKSLIHLTADMAFILQPASRERVEEIFLKESIGNDNGLLIGMNVSQLINYRSKNSNVKCDYIELMGQVADYLITNLNATIIFIPHSIYQKEIMNSRRNIEEGDIIAINEAFAKVQNKHKVATITSNYTSEELKGIIARCDLFIGARMHANIAAISMCVPTIAIAYNSKAPGIMKMVGLEKYVCDFRTMTFEELISKIEDMLSNRDKIVEKMTPKIEDLKESVWLNVKVVKDLLDS